jgi:hypothetical protein
MPRNIFDDDEPLLDYGSIDPMSAFGIGDRGYANVDPPYGANEPFGDQFERRAREISRQPSNVRPVQIVPQRHGPWSGSNQFGIEQEFAPDLNNNQTILKLPEWGFPQVWSVMLFASPPTIAVGATYKVLANVEAGVGGTVDSFRVDWGNGTTFRVVANALNISAFYFRSSLIPPGLRLRVIVGRQSLPGASSKVSFDALLPPGNSSQFNIEKYTKSITLLPRSFTSDPYTADIVLSFSPSTTGTVIGQITGAQLLALGNGATIPIPGGATVITIANNGPPAPSLGYQLIYNLGL